MITPFNFIIQNQIPINPISYIREDKCPICYKNSVEIYDQYNKPIGFTKLLNGLRMGKNVQLYNKVFTYMQCRNCNVEFGLDWRGGVDIPRPLSSPSQMYGFVKNNFKTIIKRE